MRFEIAYFITAALFIALLSISPYPGDFLVKIIPIALLLYSVSRGKTCGRQQLIAIALVLSAMGDVALEIGYFTPGLAAFLAGHLAYALVFCRQLHWSSKRAFTATGIVLGAVYMAFYLGPHLGAMAVPVYGYISVITFMSASAVLGRGNHWLVVLGAIVFTASDSMIALNRFVAPLPGAEYWIMFSYYGAQFLLTHDARNNGYPAREI